ncbi:MAG: sodium:proton antiporter NhaD [Planctomycetes bacterium]|nr:sodium:proton antiporter NhaD [Planctomycetota bacterium]MCB9910703.1 sodium:proton antiporter NhaD [Planctomycetota bacterium]HPF15308.1 sodium:proton antiporter NhaD [Planctomycetota bacterium]
MPLSLETLPSQAHAVTDLTGSAYGIAALVAFILAYLLVVVEDLLKLRKSKPVIMASGIIWILVALAAGPHGDVSGKVKEHVADFAELFLFLMVAMAYVHALTERHVFLRLNSVLVSSGAGLRTLFWATGCLAFVLSPVADNMTTALVLGAVVVSVGRGRPAFIAAGCTNVVVAANAGGAFSPFGDITTLMVWQAGKVETMRFLEIFIPSLVSWLVPAIVMSLSLPKIKPEPLKEEVKLGQGWWVVVLLFTATIATATLFHVLLHLPPFLGMMTGLGYYLIYGYICRVRSSKFQKGEPVDALSAVAHVEWDTLLFFFGVIMCVGGLAELGYLELASTKFYDGLGAFWANVCVGLLSAVVDNVPVMFAVLGMDPNMDPNEWLLVTLTAGIGGSLLSVGSAAGVALMGVARKEYTFMAHLKWTPIIAAGFAMGVYTLKLMHGMHN